MKRELLIKKRKQKKLTQQDMADAIEVSRTTYTGYENGTFNPPLDKAIKIKQVLKYLKDDIFLLSNVSTNDKARDNQD